MLQIQENYADLIEDVLDELSDIFNFDQPKVKIQPTFFGTILRWTRGIFLKFYENREIFHNLFLFENSEKYFWKLFENLEEIFFQKFLFWNFGLENF